MRNFRSLRLLVSCGAVMAVALAGYPAHAQQAASSGGFALNRFEPADRGSSWFVLDSVSQAGSGKPAAGALLDYQSRPLALRTSDGDTRTAIVGHVLTTHVGASVALFERFRVGMNLPLVVYNEGTSGTFRSTTYQGPADQQSVGDLRFGADARLLGRSTGPITVALGARFWAPTGSTASYTGDGGVRAGPRVSAAGQMGMVAYGASVGVTFRDPKVSSFAGAPIDHDLPFALSAGAKLANGTILVGPELYGTTVLSDAAFKTRTTPLELLLGGHFAFARGFRAGGGVGTGLVSGFGAPQVRVIGSIEWAAAVEPDEDGDGVPDAQDACRGQKGNRSADPARNGCPAEPVDVDTDGDGVPDAEDACKDVYGRPSSDKRTNGCADKDGDGISDPIDACPNEPGPATSDPKTNGCAPPPGDRDHDGILDNVDACPDVAGPKDEDPELNGCPDPDPDHDGFAGEADACPDLPGTADPDKTKNGCPDAFLRKDEIVLKKPIAFQRASEVLLVGESEPLLKAVADLMTKNPDIVKLRIEGHMDNRGAAGANKKLSELRAANVLKWLAAHGVDRSRLTSVGYGGERPIDSNDTEEGRTMNRRIELRVERSGASPKP